MSVSACPPHVYGCVCERSAPTERKRSRPPSHESVICRSDDEGLPKTLRSCSPCLLRGGQHSTPPSDSLIPSVNPSELRPLSLLLSRAAARVPISRIPRPHRKFYPNLPSHSLFVLAPSTVFCFGPSAQSSVPGSVARSHGLTDG